MAGYQYQFHWVRAGGVELCELVEYRCGLGLHPFAWMTTTVGSEQAMIALIAPSALGRSDPVTHEPFRLVAS